jgi:hypothetical protein
MFIGLVLEIPRSILEAHPHHEMVGAKIVLIPVIA